MKAKSKRKGNFPPLRFPEFKAEWKRKKLGEVAEIVGGGTPDTNIDEYWDGNIQWFTPSEIKSNFVSKSIRTITELGLKKSSAKLLPIGAILLTTRATIGDVAIAEQECATNQGFQSLIVYKNVNNKFIANWIRINKNKFIKLAKGSTFAEISKKDIEKINIFITELPEQNKIAFFLSLIDERISTQMKIIEEWEKLKKGMIDELFSQKMRFINEKKNFICKTKSLSTLLIKNNEKNKKRKYSKVQSVSNKLGFANQEEIFANRRVASINTSNYYVIRKGIFAYNPSRIDVGSLAYKVDDEISIISPLYVSFWTKKTYVVDLYLFYWFSSKYFITQMNSSFEGSVRNTLSYESLGRMKMVLPPIDKQQEIASILSSFDKKLSIERQILAQYQSQKKYLLQNMFI